MFNHKNTPEDLVFYWDMDAPNIPNDYRDASAAACIASALYEISTVDVPEPQTYKAYADRIMESLASPTYRAELGTNGNFLLMHCVGSIPHNGNTAVLKKDGKSFSLKIVSPVDAFFTARAAKRGTEAEKPIEGYTILSASVSGEPVQVIKVLLSGE